MNNYNLIVKQDQYPESPRKWDNLGTFIMQHRRCEFGDRLFETDDNSVSFKEDFKHHLNYVEDCSINNVIYLPVYMYDHSGITVSTTPFSCNWDSGQIGYIYATKEKIRNEYNVKRISNKLKNTALSVLESEIKLLDNYLTGNMYCYELYKDNNLIDSCCGFYGNDFKEQMKEGLPKKIHKLLEQTEVTYE